MVQSEAVLEAKFAELLPLPGERGQRLVLGAEARALGHGGVGAVARTSGASRGRVSRGAAEVAARSRDGGRAGAAVWRRAPAAAAADPGLLPALLALVEPGERGDPMSPLRWTVKSLRSLAGELAGAGHRAGRDTVAGLLHREGFSFQGASRTLEGTRHPDRDGQFRYINELVAAFQRAGQPVVSVDAKKKELVGDFHNGGREWRRWDPVRVRSHDFPDAAAGKAIPYGVYDLTRNTGWVSVGIDHDTAGFAVETLRRWWSGRGRADYPGASALLVTANTGGSNSYRTRAWKARLGELARQAGLEIVICHFPPGTSKWNKIEHRLFAHITMNWRGRPLTSHEVIIQTIAATTTRAGLTVHAELDPGTCPVGVAVTSDDMDTLALTRHHWHGEWNYTLHPRHAPAPPLPATPPRPAPADRAPAWLAHPTLTAMPGS